MIRKIFLLTVTACMALAASAQKDSYDIRVRNYISNFKELAIQEQLRSGVPAAVTLAQGVLETAAGSSELCSNAQNHFGIKCKSTWAGETYTYTDDARDECFRKYDNALHSYRDHSDFLKSNKRYADLFRLPPTDYAGWAQGLKKCGYATNPRYAQKLIEIIERYNLQDYTVAALGRVKEHAVLLASADPSALPGNAVPESSIGVAESAIAASAVYERDAAKAGGPVWQKEEGTEDDYYSITTKNGLKGFRARKGDMLLEYAIKNRIRYARLLEMNDLPDAPLEADMFIYLEKKHKTASKATHVVAEGETLLQISQQEGIQLEQLRALNKLGGKEQPLPGSVLHLQSPVTEKPDVYARERNQPEETVGFGYGAKRPSAEGDSGNWIETEPAASAIADQEAENTESNIANLQAVEEATEQQAAVPSEQKAEQAGKTSELDRLKAMMDQSVYGSPGKAGETQGRDEEGTVTLPARTRKASDEDPDDALRRHMNLVQRSETDFTPKQNKEQSARARDLPLKKPAHTAPRGKTVKGKSKSSKPKVAAKTGKSAKARTTSRKSGAAKSKKPPVKKKSGRK